LKPINRRSVLLTGTAAIAGVAIQSRAAGADEMPEPIESTKGGTDIGPRDPTRDAENPDVLVPPSTDKGLVPNLRFSFADAHAPLRRDSILLCMRNPATVGGSRPLQGGLWPQRTSI
jgi:hypothetical protein